MISVNCLRFLREMLRIGVFKAFSSRLLSWAWAIAEAVTLVELDFVLMSTSWFSWFDCLAVLIKAKKQRFLQVLHFVYFHPCRIQI